MAEVVEITRTEKHTPHRCQVCGKSLKSLSGLRGHMRFAHGTQMTPPAPGGAASLEALFWTKSIEMLLTLAVHNPETAKVGLEVIKLAAEQMRGPIETSEVNARAAFWRAAASLVPALPAMLADLAGAFVQHPARVPPEVPAPVA